jgi:hypothetical protein
MRFYDGMVQLEHKVIRENATRASAAKKSPVTFYMFGQLVVTNNNPQKFIIETLASPLENVDKLVGNNNMSNGVKDLVTSQDLWRLMDKSQYYGGMDKFYPSQSPVPTGDGSTYVDHYAGNSDTYSRFITMRYIAYYNLLKEWFKFDENKVYHPSPDTPASVFINNASRDYRFISQCRAFDASPEAGKKPSLLGLLGIGNANMGFVPMMTQYYKKNYLGDWFIVDVNIYFSAESKDLGPIQIDKINAIVINPSDASWIDHAGSFDINFRHSIELQKDFTSKGVLEDFWKGEIFKFFKGVSIISTH